MRKYYFLIAFMAFLLISFSIWAQVPNFDSSSLFQANLEEELLMQRKGIQTGLKMSDEWRLWIDELASQQELIKGQLDSLTSLNLTKDNFLGNAKFVKGITFIEDRLNNQKELNRKERKKLIKSRTSGMELAIFPGGLRKVNTTSTENNIEPKILDLKQNLNLKGDGSINNLSLKGFNARGVMTPLTIKDRINSNDYNEEQEAGLGYQLSDDSSFFIHYLKDETTMDSELLPVAVGLEYNNESGKITTQYEFEKSDGKEANSAGVELGINNVAKLRAIYTMVDKSASSKDNEVKDRMSTEEEMPNLKSELLNLGLDIYVDENASIKLGYQLLDENKQQLDDKTLLEKLKPHAADIKLEIKF